MWWVRALLAFPVALPACAELKKLSVAFEPSDCVSCTQSLPERMGRIRGVANARLTEGKPPKLELELASGNRVRIGRIRETIEQDGTKWVKADVEASGVCEKVGEGWVLKLFDGDAGVPMKGSTQSGACGIKGIVGRDGVLLVE